MQYLGVEKNPESVLREVDRVSLLATFLTDVRFELIISSKHFLLMIWTTLVEYHVTNHHEQTFSFSGESPSQRLLARNINQALTHPLPKLLLRSPELVLVGANYSCCLFCLHVVRFHSDIGIRSVESSSAWRLKELHSIAA